MTNSEHLHIVCFDIPYPPTYGGAIDVFYRIRSLYETGIKISLHCFYKPGEMQHYEALESICEDTYYYSRDCSFSQNLHIRPYEVASRSSKQLLKDLLSDDYPILFEGLVCCELIDHPALRNRLKLFRECNVEHNYYWELGKATPYIWKKFFYMAEAVKLRLFERKLNYASSILALSHNDETHFFQRFPHIKTIYLPCSHPFQSINISEGKSDYILYQGNLAVPENEKAANYIINEIASVLPTYQFVIAGMHPGPKLKRNISAHKNVRLVDSPSNEKMDQLVKGAQINLLITFQATGLKLKLLNVLYQGRHVVTNEKMVAGTELAQLCHVGRSTTELIDLCKHFYNVGFDKTEITSRESLLNGIFSNRHSAFVLQRTLQDNGIVTMPRETSENRKVSIVIPIYNTEKYLNQCLDSLINQTFTNWEAVLVNDASTDGSAMIAESYCHKDNRFRLINLQRNRGQSVARNIGIKHISGDYLSFVDSDDRIEPDYLEVLIHGIGSADMIQCGYKRITEQQSIIKEQIPDNCSKYTITSPCMRLYRSEWIREHKIEFPEGMVYEDVLFSARLWQKHPKIKIENYSGYLYLVNPTSTTSRRHDTRRIFRELHDLHIRFFQYNALRIRLRLHFLKENIFRK